MRKTYKDPETVEFSVTNLRIGKDVQNARQAASLWEEFTVSPIPTTESICSGSKALSA